LQKQQVAMASSSPFADERALVVRSRRDDPNALVVRFGLPFVARERAEVIGWNASIGISSGATLKMQPSSFLFVEALSGTEHCRRLCVPQSAPVSRLRTAAIKCSIA
jgi:hypothetical protein